MVVAEIWEPLTYGVTVDPNGTQGHCTHVMVAEIRVSLQISPEINKATLFYCGPS